MPQRPKHLRRSDPWPIWRSRAMNRS